MELYPENLNTLLELMGKIEDLATVDGVFEIEIRVRIDDCETWTVIGFGESGDPCVLRFEEPIKPIKPANVFTINKINQIPCGEWPQATL